MNAKWNALTRRTLLEAAQGAKNKLGVAWCVGRERRVCMLFVGSLDKGFVALWRLSASRSPEKKKEQNFAEKNSCVTNFWLSPTGQEIWLAPPFT